MLEIGTVEAPWGKQHSGGVIQRAGALERVQQQVGVVVDGRDALGGEQLGEQAHHHLAVFEHVADTTGGAQVVFQHEIAAIAIADQVHAGDVRIQAPVQVQALHGDLITLVGQDLLWRDDPGLEDALVVVDVFQKQVQGLHALDTAALDRTPLAGADAARDDIEGDQPLGVLFVAIQGKGDTGAVEQQVGLAPALLQQLQRGVRQPAGELLVVRAAAAVRVVHFIEKSPGHTHSLPPLPAASLPFICVFQGAALLVSGGVFSLGRVGLRVHSVHQPALQ